MKKPRKWSVVGLKTGVIYFQSHDWQECIDVACTVKQMHFNRTGKYAMLGVI